MGAVDGDAYEERALEWLLGEVRELLGEMKRQGVDREVQRLVAGNYLFGLACRFDGSDESSATLCFVDNRALIRSDGECSLHDYVLGTVDDVLGI